MGFCLGFDLNGAAEVGIKNEQARVPVRWFKQSDWASFRFA